jgi:hypothetical protein
MGQPELEQWLRKVERAASRQEVFELLDQFRPLDWTDQQRAAMAHVYVRVLEKLKDDSGPVETAAATSEAADGPVWYEKM